ncbi:rhomboid protease GluP [Streptococcus sp. NPS 308]|uniref:rhomboid family intramembrane serine protease n=1 Tax=Streptococcus sp. NPS 308 TaxID=1902136 RepID=UPI000875E15C|nr:rhomboid family intramembrane serine protease [Streptococcus sp. NPS 308]BAV79131.1 rhomboid protease GluP [Streptococcus sp. NPS 308]
MKEIFDKRHPVTSFFLLVTGFVFLLMLITTGINFDRVKTLFQFGAMYGPIIRLFPEQLWRLFSAIFVHIGWEHFIVNMLSLYFLGGQVEEIFGSKQFLFLYLLSGMMGNLFVFAFTPKVLAAGASTSLYGLFAAIIVLRYATRSPYIQQLGQSYLTLFVINIIGSVLIPGISLAGHIGGAVGGAFLAVVFPVRSERRIYSFGQRLGATVLFIALAVFLFYKGMSYV